jgi:transposase
MLPDGTACLHCYKPTGRVYRCPASGLTAHRDGLGAANLLLQHYTGEPGHLRPARETYRDPLVWKRRPLDTLELAREPTVG